MKNVIHKTLYALLLCGISTVSLWAMDYSDPYESGYEPKRTSGRSLEEIVRERQKERVEHSTRLSHQQIHNILYDTSTSPQDPHEDDQDEQPAQQTTSTHISIGDVVRSDLSSEQIEDYASRLLEEYRKERLTDTTTSDENLLDRIISEKMPEIAEFSEDSQENIKRLFFEKLQQQPQESHVLPEQPQKSQALPKQPQEPFSWKSRWNKFWEEKSWKNASNLVQTEKQYVKTVIADALAGDSESIELFRSKEAKEYIKDKYTSDEKRELVTSMSKSLYDAYQKQLELSEERNKRAVVSQYEKNLATINRKLEQDIQTINDRLKKEITILERVKKLKDDFNTENTIMNKIESEFNLTHEQATDYAHTGTAKSEFMAHQSIAEKKIIELQNIAQEAIQKIQSEYDTSILDDISASRDNIKKIKSIGKELSTSLEEICNNDQQIITTYDRRIENNIVNFVDFSTFSFDPTKTFAENMKQLISDQNLNVPVHQSEGRDQFDEQLKEAIINHYVPKYAIMLGDISNVQRQNIISTIVKKIPNFELFTQDLQLAILKQNGITLTTEEYDDLKMEHLISKAEALTHTDEPFTRSNK